MTDYFDLARIVRFVCVGVGVAAFFMVLTYLLVSSGVAPFLASILAYGVCFVAAYFLQRYWTFEAKHPHREALARYLVLQLACALFSGLVPQVAIDRFGATPLVASGLAAFTAGVLSYIGSACFVFPDARRQSA